MPADSRFDNYSGFQNYPTLSGSPPCRPGRHGRAQSSSSLKSLGGARHGQISLRLSAPRAILTVVSHTWGRPVGEHRDGWVVVDVETSGFRPGQARILSVAALALDASGTDGYVTTIPIKCLGDRLAINAITKPGGSVQVELLNVAESYQLNIPEAYQCSDKKPIVECIVSDSFEGDEVSHFVTFKGSKDIKSLLGKTVKLRFHLRDAKLYSFAFLKSDGG